MRRAAAIVAALTCLPPPGAADAASGQRAVPYWASIGPGRARMRTGPARTYPATWLYQRADLPVRVVAIFKQWRKVQDPDGTEGWMQATLLRTQRTAIVRSDAPLDMHQSASRAARLMWRAAPGVVGRISECGNGWCRFQVDDRAAYVPVDGLWGVDAAEALP